MIQSLIAAVRACATVAVAVGSVCVFIPTAAAVAQDQPGNRTVGNKYAALFAVNRDGGASLKAAIANAVATNPGDARLIVELASQGSPKQQAAAAAGLAQAAQIASAKGDSDAAAAIKSAVDDAGGSLATAYASSSESSSDGGESETRVTQNNQDSKDNRSTNAPVSPAKP
jgi:hypothetical protein